MVGDGTVPTRPSHRAGSRLAVALAALALIVTGCGGAGRTSTATVETTRSGIAPATWTLDPRVEMDATTTELAVLVQRVECNSGRT